MNDRYFACQDCQTYIEAGYRWAYWTLEAPEVVGRGLAVDVDTVLAAGEYWRGGEGAGWLNKLLPEVARFLAKHKRHDITYGEWEDFLGVDRERMSEWTEEKAGR